MIPAHPADSRYVVLLGRPQLRKAAAEDLILLMRQARAADDLEQENRC
jgi:hypothetical protein